MSLARRTASYLASLAPAGYGISDAASGVANYLLDSYFAKVDERQRQAAMDYDPMPHDLSDHIRELWLGCEIHHCLNLSQTYPAFAKGKNAWAFSRLFDVFAGPGAPYRMVPFIESYQYKESIKHSSEFHVQSEQINISLVESVTLPVFGTFFIEDAVTGDHLVVQIDFCYYVMGCSVTVMAAPDKQAAAEKFFADLHASMQANDIYFKQCLTFNKGHLDFFGIIPTTWEEVVLKDELREKIRKNTIGILANMSSLAAVGMVPNRNILLISPPGMAKTTMFRATSNEVEGRATRIWCTGKSIMYPEHVTSLFEAARSLAPCMVLIEDMDLFGGERTMAGRDSSVLNEFLAQLDGAQTNAGLIVMASTNDIASMDEALVNRPGRFSVKVEIPFPDAEDRMRLLHKFLAAYNVVPDASVSKETVKGVVDLCAGFTGDYIREVAKAAVIQATSEGREGEGDVSLSADDLMTAIQQVLQDFRIGKKARKHIEVDAELEDDVVVASDMPAVLAASGDAPALAPIDS